MKTKHLTLRTIDFLTEHSYNKKQDVNNIFVINNIAQTCYQ